jgi:hypothetical protein
MIRALQLLLVLLAAVVCAGCSAWRMAVARAEIRRIEEDWGVQTRLRILEKKRLWEESIYGRE